MAFFSDLGRELRYSLRLAVNLQLISLLGEEGVEVW